MDQNSTSEALNFMEPEYPLSLLEMAVSYSYPEAE
jgi:hypothetical protein